jgi:hypothetical protein
MDVDAVKSANDKSSKQKASAISALVVSKSGSGGDQYFPIPIIPIPNIGTAPNL